MLKDMPPYMKPFVPLIAAMGVIFFVDFGMLLVGEWQDANYWSFGIRCAGACITIGMGFWWRSAYRKFKASLTAMSPLGDPSSYAAMSEAQAASLGIEPAFSMPPRCKGTLNSAGVEPCPDYAMTSRTQLCNYCWSDSVEDRLAPPPG